MALPFSWTGPILSPPTTPLDGKHLDSLCNSTIYSPDGKIAGHTVITHVDQLSNATPTKILAARTDVGHDLTRKPGKNQLRLAVPDALQFLVGTIVAPVPQYRDLRSAAGAP